MRCCLYIILWSVVYWSFGSLPPATAQNGPPSTTELITRALKKHRSHKYRSAIIDYSLALHYDPQLPYAYYNRGLVYLELGAKADACQNFRKARSLGVHLAKDLLRTHCRSYKNNGQPIVKLPQTAEEYLIRGIKKERDGQYRDAIMACTIALKLNPELIYGYYYRGIAAIKLGDVQVGCQDLSKAAEAGADVVDDFMKKHCPAVYKEWLHTQQDTLTAFEYYRRGITRGYFGDFKGAIVEFTKAIYKDPQDAQSYYNRGIAKTALDSHRAAIEDFDKAIALAPDSARFYYNRGVVRMFVGDHSGAKADFDKTIALGLDDPTTFCRRGEASIRVEQYRAAIEDCNKALALDSTYAEAYFYRGVAQSRQLRYKAALEDFNTALRLDPELAEAYLERALTKRALGHEDGILSDLNQAIRYDSTSTQAYYNRGITRTTQGQYQKAIDDFDRALQLSPNNGNIYVDRGTTLILVGREKAACSDFRKARQMNVEGVGEMIEEYCE